MQKILLKREFFVLCDTVKIEYVHYLEEKKQPIKKIAIGKTQKKIAKNLNLMKSISIFGKMSLRCSYFIPGIFPYQIWYQYNFPFSI